MIHTSISSTRRSPRRGYAFLMCLVLIIPMLVIGLVVMMQSAGQKKELGSTADQARAQTLAEAGIAEAVMSIRHGGNGGVGNRAAPVGLGDGLFWVQATYGAGKQVSLVSAGMSGQGRAAVQTVVQVRADPWRTFALFSNQSTDLKGQFFLDSFDSRLGSYASQVPGGSTFAGDDAVIGSNANVDIGGGSTIHGSLQPGPGGTAIIGGGSTVSGSTTPATQPILLPPVTAPALPAGGPLVVIGIMTLPPGDHRYSSISVIGTLIIPGPSTIVVDGAFDISNHSQVTVSSGGAVSCYVGGNMSMGTMAGIDTPTLDPTQFSVFLTGDSTQTAVFMPHGDFYGTVYGPHATMQLGNDLNLFGAICSDRIFCQNPKVKVHYDAALADVLGSGGVQAGAVFTMPATFPDPALLRDRRDPFAVTGLQRGALAKPCDGWDMSGFPPGF